MLAARVGDMHVCPLIDGVKPHVGGPVNPPGVPTVLIGGMPAAIAPGNTCTCASVPDMTTIGCPTVMIGGRQAVRALVDTTAHGGRIVVGCPTVLIGAGGMSMGAVTAAMDAAQAALDAAVALNEEKSELEQLIASGDADQADINRLNEVNNQLDNP